MTELNIEYAPKSEDSDRDNWHDRIVEYLRKYLSQPFDRGDPASADFAVGDLTTDNTWNDLDLSSIAPEDTIAVILRVSIDDDSATSRINFRKNGNSDIIASPTARMQVAGIPVDHEVIVFCDTSRVIEYRGTNTTFSTIDITVLGWFK